MLSATVLDVSNVRNCNDGKGRNTRVTHTNDYLPRSFAARKCEFINIILPVINSLKMSVFHPFGKDLSSSFFLFRVKMDKNV